MSSVSGDGGLRFAPGRAVLYSFSAIASLTLLDAGVKWLTSDYAVPQIAFIRYLFGLALAVILASRMGGLGRSPPGGRSGTACARCSTSPP